MSLAALHVLHQRRSDDPGHVAPGLRGELRESFHVETCQRRLWITTASRLDSVNPESLDTLERYSGLEAYEFLLRVACGLESEIKGETEIFGQIKCEWQRYSSERPADFRALAPWIQRVFEDTKEIRSRYLQGFGGSSYGSLVRKMLKSRPRGPVLLVGAGQLAETVLPYLREHEVLVWNRSERRLRELLERVSASQPGARVEALAPGRELEGWRRAMHVVVCIPADPSVDEGRIGAWLERESRPGASVIHLGCTDGDIGQWAHIEGFQPLKDLFEIRRSQDLARTEQIGKAIQACAAAARRRASELAPADALQLEEVAVFA